MDKITTIYNQYSDNLYRFCVSISHDKARAEDAVSKVFLKLIELDQEINMDTIKSWLFTVAHRELISEIRFNSKFGDNDQIEGFEEILSDKDKINELITEEQITVIKDNLAKLASGEREIIGLKLWEEFTFKQISEIMDKPENTVKSLYYRALDALKIFISADERIDVRLKSIGFPFIFLGFIKAGESTDYKLLTNLLNNLKMENVDTKNVESQAQTTADSANVSKGAATNTAAISGKTIAIISGVTISLIALVAAAIVGVNLATERVSNDTSSDETEVEQAQIEEDSELEDNDVTESEELAQGESNNNPEVISVEEFTIENLPSFGFSYDNSDWDLDISTSVDANSVPASVSLINQDGSILKYEFTYLTIGGANSECKAGTYTIIGDKRGRVPTGDRSYEYLSGMQEFEEWLEANREFFQGAEETFAGSDYCYSEGFEFAITQPNSDVIAQTERNNVLNGSKGNYMVKITMDNATESSLEAVDQVVLNTTF